MTAINRTEEEKLKTLEYKTVNYMKSDKEELSNL
jgi:hypothetical protein